MSGLIPGALKRSSPRMNAGAPTTNRPASMQTALASWLFIPVVIAYLRFRAGWLGKHRLHGCRVQGLKRLRKKSGDEWKCVPQRLKPYLFSIAYVRAEARTLQRTEFFRSL